VPAFAPDQTHVSGPPVTEKFKSRKMKMKSLLTAFLMASVVVFIGCNKDDDNGVDPQMPTVVSTSPDGNDTGVERNAVVRFSFSQVMDATTINATTFLLKQGTNVIEGTFTYADSTATFTPTQPLAAGTVYAATATTGIEDLAGNPLEEDFEWDFTTGGTTTALATVELGAAGNYVILAKTAINNNPTSAITGDAGISPAAGSYITGFSLVDATGYATAAQVTGRVYAADMADPTPGNLTTAVDNMNTAYNDAAGRPSPDFFELSTGNIGGKTLTPGVYKWTNTVTVPSSITIAGGPGDIWIFQIAQDLTVSTGVTVTLSGGARAENIFWQVAGEVTIGTLSHFEGVVLSKTGITLTTGASLTGRALAQTAVILDQNVVTQPE